MNNKLTFCQSLSLLVLLSAVISQLSTAHAQGTAFTYQGRLNDGVNPANGSYDLRLIAYDNSVGGSQQGSTLTSSATTVSNGLFIVTLNFGTIFTGGPRWLEIAVRTNGAGGFTILSPRQPLTPAPYAITAANVTAGAGLAGTYGSAVTFNNAGNNFSGSGAGLANVNAVTLNGLASASLWQLGGNTVANGQFLGSVNNQPLEFRANGLRAFRVEPNPNDGTHSNIVSVVSGSPANSIAPGIFGATILGGGAVNYLGFPLSNSVTADFGTVVGGGANTASGLGAIAMGLGATASGYNSTAIGGAATASGTYSTALGGAIASGDYSTAVGNSIASGHDSTALGGGKAEGTNSFAVGLLAEAPGRSAVSIGEDTIAIGNNSVAMGWNSYAYQPYGFAAGKQAIAAHRGAFVWADSLGTTFSSTANDQFLIRAAGGVGIGLSNPAGQLHVASAGGSPQVQITQNTGSDFTRLRMNVAGSPSWEMDVSGGATPSISWWTGTLRMSLDYNGNLVTTGTVNGTSDRNAKEKFTSVSSREVLDKVAALPISEWNFKHEATRHIGPMAQDFYAAFNVGMDDKHIATVDEGGVALAAIKGLNEKMDSENAALRAENAELKQKAARLDELEHRLSTVEQRLAK